MTAAADAPGDPADPGEPVIVALGANLGDPVATLVAAVRDLAVLAPTVGLQMRALAPLYRSPPWQTEGPDYFNSVVLLETTSPADEDAPLALLGHLQAIEARHGRQRPYRWAPRTLDLDLIVYGARRQRCSALELPHPRALERAFVLQPLHDVAPHLAWPAGSPGEPPWPHRLAALDRTALQLVHDARWPQAAAESPYTRSGLSFG